MKVKVLREFKDRTEGLKLRKIGEILEVSKERAEKLTGMKLAEVISEQKTNTGKKEG